MVGIVSKMPFAAAVSGALAASLAPRAPAEPLIASFASVEAATAPTPALVYVSKSRTGSYAAFRGFGAVNALPGDVLPEF